MEVLSRDQLAEIRRLNDQFRTTFRGGEILLMASVAAIPSPDKATGLQAVAEFKDFNEENDPHQEHDYGSFDLSGREWWFKINCYSLNLEHASEDPADPAKTKRVMVLGLAMDR